MPRGAVKQPRQCTCCGVVKPEMQFSPGRPHAAYHCIECGVWLTLFRKVFGRVRNLDKNRENCRKRAYEAQIRRRSKASLSLAEVIQTLWR